MQNVVSVVNLKVEERRGGKRRNGDNGGDGSDGNGDCVGDSCVMKLSRVKRQEQGTEK